MQSSATNLLHKVEERGMMNNLYTITGLAFRNVFLLFVVGFVFLLRLPGCSPQPAPIKMEEKKVTKEEWVEGTLARFTLEEKISQMIMSRSYGYYYSSDADQYKLLHHLVKEHKVGGLIFFQGDVYETAEMINRCQSWADVPLLIAADFEWGTGMRIRRGTRFPEAMAVGATRDTSLAYAMGKAIGEEARAMGVRQDFAPVADVNNNPNNPVINTRSFGENPLLVAKMVGAFSDGLQSAGVLATAKHFPGHGDTQVDSHIDLPTINVSKGRLDSVELIPFKALFQHNVASVMVAHLTVPSVDSTQGMPSTLSEPIITGLLKNQLGFEGLIVTDALDMGAVVNKFGSDSIAVKSVQAGADILLILPDEDKAIEALIDAVKSGKIAEERINYSVRKILGLKFELGLNEKRYTNLDSIREIIETPEHLTLAKEIARQSITLLKNNSVLPLEQSNRKKILNLVVADAENYRTEIHRNTMMWPNEAVGNYLTTQLKRKGGTIEQINVDPSRNKLDFDAILKKAQKSDVILLSLFSKARSGSGIFGISSQLGEFTKNILKLDKPVIAIGLGSPYVLADAQDAGAILCSYSDCEPSTEAIVEALYGEIPINGKLPVNIPPQYAYGDGINLPQSILRQERPDNAGFDRDSLALVDSIITKAIKDTAFPGAEIAIVKNGALIYNKSFGSQEYLTTSPRINNQTMYDMASLTKVIATTSSVMKLYDEGKLSLDDTVTKYIPEFGNHGKERITIRNLLLHNAGLPPFKQLYLTCTTPQQVLDSVFQTELIYKTGDSTVYSDFGFITLAKIVERITGKTLDQYTLRTFFEPMGLKRTMFKPSESLWDNIAPTELDTITRKKLVHGVVHDENAYTLGGVSGHAGLFSTASDIAIFMQMLMNNGSYGGVQYIKPATVTMFTSRQSPKSTRGLGWDTKSITGYSTAGHLFSDLSYGHTGFTGTSIWVDPIRDLAVIFFTNRVNPTRANTKISKVRPLVHDAVIKALTK